MGLIIDVFRIFLTQNQKFIRIASITSDFSAVAIAAFDFPIIA